MSRKVAMTTGGNSGYMGQRKQEANRVVSALCLNWKRVFEIDESVIVAIVY